MVLGATLAQKTLLLLWRPEVAERVFVAPEGQHFTGCVAQQASIVSISGRTSAVVLL